MIEDYENALGALNAMSYSLDLKKAMILIKLNNFQKTISVLKITVRPDILNTDNYS